MTNGNNNKIEQKEKENRIRKTSAWRNTRREKYGKATDEAKLIIIKCLKTLALGMKEIKALIC